MIELMKEILILFLNRVDKYDLQVEKIEGKLRNLLQKDKIYKEITWSPLIAESPHNMTVQSVWERRDRNGAASDESDWRASVNPKRKKKKKI